MNDCKCMILLILGLCGTLLYLGPGRDITNRWEAEWQQELKTIRDEGYSLGIKRADVKSPYQWDHGKTRHSEWTRAYNEGVRASYDPKPEPKPPQWLTVDEIVAKWKREDAYARWKKEASDRPFMIPLFVWPPMKEKPCSDCP